MQAGPFCPASLTIMLFCIYGDGVCTVVAIDTFPSSDSIIAGADERAITA